MFIHNISPILFTIGTFEIRYYGLVYALGFLLGYFYIKQLVKQQKLKMSLDDVDSLFLYLIIGGIVGGRLGEFLFYNTEVLFSAPLTIFKVWQGGMSIHGGIIGAVLGIYLFSRKRKHITVIELTDVLVLPLSLVLFFGRIANFLNSELVGRITQVSWCVQFQNAPNPLDRIGCRHPSQLYEAIKNIFIFSVLLLHQQYTRTKQQKWFSRQGIPTAMFLLLYGILRIITNIWRDDVIYGFFSMGQWLSFIMVIIGIVWLVLLWNTHTTAIEQKNTTSKHNEKIQQSTKHSHTIKNKKRKKRN